MSFRTSSISFGVAAALFACVGFVQAELDESRESSTPAMIAELSPGLRFAHAALGSFRSWVVNALWLRQAYLEEQGRVGEAAQVADLILTVSPRFEGAWTYQSSRLAFDLARYSQDPAERFEWIVRSIDLIRSDALRYLPASPELHRHLSYLFWFKIGGGDDPFEAPPDSYQPEYRALFADRWNVIVGASERASLERIAAIDEKDPAWDRLEAVFRDREVELQSIDEIELRAIAAELEGDDRLAFRARLLRERFNMDPRLMLELVDRLGPIDFRHPGAHAIYWSTRGRLRLEGASTYDEAAAEQAFAAAFELDGQVYSGLSALMRHGRVELESRGEWRFSPEPGVFAAFRKSRLQGQTIESADETDREQYFHLVRRAIFRAEFGGHPARAREILEKSEIGGTVDSALRTLARNHVKEYEPAADGLVGLSIVGFRYAYGEGGQKPAAQWFALVSEIGPEFVDDFDMSEVFREGAERFFASPRMPYPEKVRTWPHLDPGLHWSLGYQTLIDLAFAARERSRGDERSGLRTPRTLEEEFPGLPNILHTIRRQAQENEE